MSPAPLRLCVALMLLKFSSGEVGRSDRGRVRLHAKVGAHAAAAELPADRGSYTRGLRHEQPAAAGDHAHASQHKPAAAAGDHAHALQHKPAVAAGDHAHALQHKPAAAAGDHAHALQHKPAVAGGNDTHALRHRPLPEGPSKKIDKTFDSLHWFETTKCTEGQEEATESGLESDSTPERVQEEYSVFTNGTEGSNSLQDSNNGTDDTSEAPVYQRPPPRNSQEAFYDDQ